MDEEGLLGSAVSIHRAVAKQPVLAAWEMTPLFDGNEVCQVLPRLPKGPAMRDVIDAMLSWQLTEKDVYSAVAELQAGTDALTAQQQQKGGGLLRPLQPVEQLCASFLRAEFPDYAPAESAEAMAGAEGAAVRLRPL